MERWVGGMLRACSAGLQGSRPRWGAEGQVARPNDNLQVITATARRIFTIFGAELPK